MYMYYGMGKANGKRELHEILFRGEEEGAKQGIKRRLGLR
jgi:hypothetical protein